MPRSRFAVMGLMLVFLISGGPAISQPVSDRLVVRFAPGEIEPPAGRSAGSVYEFSFAHPALRLSLRDAGVVYLSKLFPAFRSDDRFSTNLIGEPVLLDDLRGYYIVSLSSAAAVDVESRLRASPGVEHVELPQPRELLSPCLPQNVDTHFNKQWWLHNTGQFLCTPVNPAFAFPALVADESIPNLTTDINAPEAWCITTGSPSVRVGIIDTGIWAAHSDLDASLPIAGNFMPLCPIPGPHCLQDNDPFLDCNFISSDVPEDDQSHGTAVGGIVAGIGNNGHGVAGVAWGVNLVAIKIFHCTGSTSACLSARAIDWARTDSIPIVNMSYAWDLPSDPERAAVRNAFYSGQLLVPGIGNENGTNIKYPAGYEKMVCTVGAFFGNGRRWDEGVNRGSNWGPWIDLSAPGGNMIVTTDFGCRQNPDSYYDLSNCADPILGRDFGGTSAATPVVSGVAALLKSKYPSLLGEDLYQAMIRTAKHPDPDAPTTQVRMFDDSTKAFFDDSAGFGHVRADTALKLFAEPRQILQQSLVGLSEVGVFESMRELRNIPGMLDGIYTVRRHVLRRAVTFTPPYTGTPMAWVRSSGTLGVKDVSPYDYNVEVNWGRIVSITAASCTLETNVFELMGVTPTWFPILPSKARIALTTVGVPLGGGGGGASSGSPVARDDGQRPGSVVPKIFALHENRPDPFSRATTIRFDLPTEATVRLDIFDAQGRLVRTLANGQYPAGLHAVDWDQVDATGRQLRAGVYLYRIQAGSFRDQKKMVVLAR